MFTKTKYDKNASVLEFKKSINRNNYMLYDGYHIHENKCKNYRQPRNTRSFVRQGDLELRTDIESKIQNRHVPINKENKTYLDYAEKENLLDRDKECRNFDEKVFEIAPPEQYTLNSHPKKLSWKSYAEKVITPFMYIDKQKAISVDGNHPFYQNQSGFAFNRPINTREIVRNTNFEFSRSKRLKCLDSGKTYKGISNCTKISD